MKKYLLLLLLLVLAACRTQDMPDTDIADNGIVIEETPAPTPEPTSEPTYQPTSQPTTEPDPTPTPEPHISSIPLEGLSSHFARLDALLDEDGGALWGVPLHLPFMFYDPDTRHVAANRQDPQGVLAPQEGVYVGVLPQGALIRNSIVQFGAMQWAMMSLHDLLLHQTEDDPVDPLGSMLHWAFQVWKPQLFGSRQATTYNYAHFSGVEQRTFLRMEMHALLAAVKEAQEESRMEMIRTALSIRAHRRDGLSRQAIINEDDLVIDTGLYGYMTMKLWGSDVDEVIHNIERDMLPVDEYDQNLQWSFAHNTGLLYAMLLDAVGADWRHNITFETDLGDLLAYHTGIDEFIPIDALDVERFGYSAILAVEQGWVTFRQGLNDSARALFTGQAPLLWMLSGGQDNVTEAFSLNVVGLGWTRSGSVFYGTFTYEGEFGTLRGENTFRVLDRFDPATTTAPSYAVSAVDMKIEGNRVTGHGWEIELNEGYYIMELMSNNFWIMRR